MSTDTNLKAAILDVLASGNWMWVKPVYAAVRRRYVGADYTTLSNLLDQLEEDGKLEGEYVAKKGAVRWRLAEGMRRRNQGHRIPNTTVQLGRALELVTADGERVTLWDEVAGWQMLTTPNAETMRPGRAKLFLVPGELQQLGELAPNSAGAATYDSWHDREPELLGELDAPDGFPDKLGRAMRVDYSSDKWGTVGTVVQYTHDFNDGSPPLVYADLDGNNSPRGFVLVGGTMAITPEGIA